VSRNFDYSRYELKLRFFSKYCGLGFWCLTQEFLYGLVLIASQMSNGTLEFYWLSWKLTLVKIMHL
jgi:hypothetical protein